ncbi:ion channel [Acinetobacter sp. YH16032]|uniref:ion channel n=1 Tax=Acinetobacter sp. YH16032 TaxID=2601181 RepID=UPI0015D1CA98|nr:ion channel [Acinetobacter sp. YH16032]
MSLICRAIRDLVRLPSTCLLILQLLILFLAVISSHDLAYRSMTWILGALVLLIIAKVIKMTPIFSAVGLFGVLGALIFSFLILIGYHQAYIQITAHVFEVIAYTTAAYGLVRYMFEDRYLTKDELFAAAAVFTLIAWSFAFLYSICQLHDPLSFSITPEQSVQHSWLDLLFLRFSIQSATGLSDIMPLSPLARLIAMIQMFSGVMYLALIVSLLIALQYIAHLPKHQDD